MGEDQGRGLLQATGTWIVRLLDRYVVGLLILLFVAGCATLTFTFFRLTTNTVQIATLEGAAAYSSALQEFRTLYTSEIVTRVSNQGVVVTHDYKDKPGAVPLPITLSIQLAEQLGARGGFKARIYSDFPFPTRVDGGPRDAFERDAIGALRRAPDLPFYRFEQLEGRNVLRYATADRMRPSCISCHNSHPESPKRDWAVGDVRGVISVMRPLDRLDAETAANTRTTVLILGGMGAIGLFALWLVIRRLRSNAATLRDRADEAERSAIALRASEQRYQLAATGANDGLWDWDLSTDAIFYSKRFAEILGRETTELGTGSAGWYEHVHPEDRERLRSDIAEHVRGESSQLETEYRLIHKDGQVRWCLCRGMVVRGADGMATRMAGSLTDLTFRKLVEQRLEYAAFHDALTGLPNRALFLDRLTHRISSRSEGPFAVLFLDLDRFKVVNDSLGHTAGDELLIAVSRRIERCVRSGDTVARFGGDEFAVLLENVGDQAEVAVVAERLFDEMRAATRVGGDCDVFAFPSIGIAFGPGGYQFAEEMLRDADTAMYRAKSLGGSHYQIFDSTMHARAVTLLNLESDLRRAVERNEFEVHYQPIVRMSDGELVGFEALIRWNHPDRGIISPGDFLPLAEETRLICKIGALTRRTACMKFKEWLDKRGDSPTKLSLSLNLSAIEFGEPGLVPELLALLENTSLSPSDIILELTESVFIHNTDTVRSLLTELHRLQFRLSLDDFGTGYSSLSYLYQFPLDHLKIDRAFVNKLGSKTQDTIVAAIITLAHQLRLEIVAEGVETEDQAARLRELGAEFGQGYYYACPLTVGDATPLVLKRIVVPTQTTPPSGAGSESTDTINL